MRRLLVKIHYAILVAIEDYPWWLRSQAYVGWWISLIPKLPFMIAYVWGDEDDQHYSDHTGDGWRN